MVRRGGRQLHVDEGAGQVTRLQFALDERAVVVDEEREVAAQDDGRLVEQVESVGQGNPERPPGLVRRRTADWKMYSRGEVTSP